MDINNPEELLKYIDENIKIDLRAKDERGEVFTPMVLVNEMLDKLPDYVWDNPDLKWLDPSGGIGNFTIAIYYRLMNALIDIIKDPKIRKKHILENMIYMVEIDKSNCDILKTIFCGKKYKLNIFEGSFLDYKNDIMFDIIVGNPPYQDTDDSGKRKAKNRNLWSVFIEKSFNNFLKDNGYLLFITPYSFMSLGFKYKDIFYKNHIIYLNIKECEKHFKVGSSFCYYLIKKTPHKKSRKVKCLYNKKLYESDIYINDDTYFLPILLSKDSLSIIHKFYNNKLEKISFEKSGELDTHNKKPLIGKCNNVFINPIRHTTKNKDLCSSFKHTLADKNKILMNKSSKLEPIFDNGNLGITENQLYYLTNNNKYVNVLNSKLYRFIFLICKWSGFNNGLIFKNIPYIDNFTTEEEIYSIFKLTKEEIKLIEYKK